MRLLFISLPLLLLSSCLIAGNEFNYDKTSTLDFNQINSAEYIGHFGEPYRTLTKTTGDGTYKQVVFYRSSKPFLGEVSRRTLILEFKDERLNAYIYASSFDSGKTRIDLSKASQIKVGVSTKIDLLTSLGKPYGKALCPSLLRDFKDRCAKSKEVWSWIEVNKTPTFGNIDPLYIKSLFVMFDADGKVIDLESNDSQ